MKGSLIISLDFELHWGGAEVWDLAEKSSCFLNTRAVILKMVELFQEYDIRVTWATVGFLFAESRDEANVYFPTKEPAYLNQNFNYYNLFTNNEVGVDEKQDPFHFGASLVQEILKFEGQELASHTFCHYYCNEAGQTKEEFELDLQATQKIAQSKYQTELHSLVFPRNQYNSNYLEILKNNQYKVIRTNPDVWFWKINHKLISLARALDTLLPISRSLSFKNTEIKEDHSVVLLPASRFFRPYSKKEQWIQKLKLRRIKKEMLFAAKNGENYHLWWHPHNFGYFPEENMRQLRELLQFYKKLNTRYNFSSKNMGDFKITDLR